jgi:hypothetical protein
MGKPTWILTTLLVAATACDQPPTSPDVDSQFSHGPALNGHEGTIQLEGFTRFAFYVPKEHRFIADGYETTFLPCTAELTFDHDHGFLLHTKEYIAGTDPLMLYREVTFTGKMTPSGQLKFSWPATWLEFGAVASDVLAEVRLHTGYALSGRGIKQNTLQYEGHFDGKALFAATHFIGKQEQPGVLPLFVEVVDSPAMVNFMIDLHTVSEKPAPVVLSGTLTYWTYAPKIKTVLQDAPFAVPTPGTTTTLEFLGGKGVRLQLHEDHSAAGEGDRWTTLQGTLERNGDLTLDYVGLGGMPMPEWAPGVPFLVGMVQWHSGCVITSGDFPRYHGRFDGEELVAAATFKSLCPGPSGTPDAPLFPVPVVGRDGHTLTPVDWAWKMRLRVPGDHDGHGDHGHHD